MTCLRPTLETYARRVTSELQPRLRGVFGGMLRHYLPQHWVLNAEGEVYTLTVDTDGLCSVHLGPSATPDVTLEVGHDRLRWALEHGRATGGPGGPYSVSYQTKKGETAYRFLKDRFGL